MVLGGVGGLVAGGLVTGGTVTGRGLSGRQSAPTSAPALDDELDRAGR